MPRESGSTKTSAVASLEEDMIACGEMEEELREVLRHDFGWAVHSSSF